MKNLLQHLTRGECFPHRTAAIEIRETHISWVLLTGSYAYKIKKPMNFGFLDFSSLEKRRHFCEEELRLNRRTAPDIYLDVVRITRQGDQLRIDGKGETIEYAVKMRQFDDSKLLSAMADRGELGETLMGELARSIAAFHQKARPAPAHSPWSDPQNVFFHVKENFDQIRELLSGQWQSELDELECRSRRCHSAMTAILESRKTSGYVRECHGDLHLGNIVLCDGRALIFDCIEFNPDLHWIDVMSEIAFLVMDLQERGYHSLSWRFLNAYLMETGDYSGLAVLEYYLAYRAMVRAKIALLRRSETDTQSDLAAAMWRQYRGYLELARAYLTPRRPLLMITHGLSASGKSSLAGYLSENLGLIWLRSDIERKRLFNLAAAEPSHSGPGEGIYTEDASRRLYTLLEAHAQTALSHHFAVIVDASFLRFDQRRSFQDLAKKLQFPYAILDCRAPPAVLRTRLRQRRRQGTDPSEADAGVLNHQLAVQEKFRETELPHRFTAPRDRGQWRQFASRLEAHLRHSGDSIESKPALLD